jgi:hypothetical protein
MGYMKYTPYIYLLFACYFIYQGITKWGNPEETPILLLMIGGLAVFMFFFRKKFAKRMEDRKNKS